MKGKDLRFEGAPGLDAELPPGWWMPQGRVGRRPFLRQEIQILLDEAIVDAGWINGQLLLSPDLLDWAPVHVLQRQLKCAEGAQLSPVDASCCRNSA